MEAVTWRATFIRYAPLIFWIGVIFFLSSDQGSMSHTSFFVRPILKFLFSSASEETLQTLHGYIRKAAHFTEYAILAYFAARTFSKSSINRLRARRYLLPLIIVTVVALLDEFNQSFEASRTSSIWDVLLDIFGGSAMVTFLMLAGRPRDGTTDANPDS
jgi:VanZ family protein